MQHGPRNPVVPGLVEALFPHRSDISTGRVEGLKWVLSYSHVHWRWARSNTSLQEAEVYIKGRHCVGKQSPRY